MNKITKISYYNNFGNGDLHYSREFIKFFNKQIPVETTYTHIRCPYILRDISSKFEKHLNTKIHDPNHIGLYIENETLFFGTWIGQNYGKWLQPNGCTINNNYKMYSYIASLLGISLSDEIEYIPTIDYSKYDIDNIKIIKDKNILVSNGPCMSGQTRNFDMNPIIIELATKHKSCSFYITHGFKTDLKNIIDVNLLINTEKSNLNEISYLSTFCDIIVGRGSGPFCFTHVKENLFDKNKTYISCGNNEKEINWITIKDYLVKEQAKQLWNNSDNGCEQILYKMIDEEINEKFGNR